MPSLTQYQVDTLCDDNTPLPLYRNSYHRSPVTENTANVFVIGCNRRLFLVVMTLHIGRQCTIHILTSVQRRAFPHV